jgi:hypothetical protein
VVAVTGAGIMGSAMTRNLVAGAARGDTPPLLAALSGQWHAAVAAGHGRQDVSAARLALGSPSHSSPAHKG